MDAKQDPETATSISSAADKDVAGRQTGDRDSVTLRYPKEKIAADHELGSRGRRNLKAGVANVITAQILSGEMRAGQRIDQDALAAELGVSRLPIREAIIMLENVGFVTSISRRGSYVASITPDDVLDHYEIFGMAIGLAARRAASMLTEEELSRLEELYVA